MAGASGYIGRHVARELASRGHDVVCLVRKHSGVDGKNDPDQMRLELTGCEVRIGDVTCPDSLSADGIRGEQFDAVVCCLASRNGGVEDSWRIDYQAGRQLLDAGRKAGAQHFVLLSAICVQKPRLAFQYAKLRLERELAESGLTYSIVRPTAYFKSLAGQVAAIKRGRPYVYFDNDAACKPIGEADLAAFMADCLEHENLYNKILPLGGPGKAMTARERGELLFELAGMQPRFRRVPVALFDVIIPLLSGLAILFPRWRDKAEFARIGRYYATEPMLLLNTDTGAVDAAATPSYGRETLRSFYERILENGLEGQELGEHRMFERAAKAHES